MNEIFTIDYLACVLFRSVGPVFRVLPVGLSLFIGKCLGRLVCAVDGRHRCRAYAQIKTMLGPGASFAQVRAITRRFYESFGQNLIEIFLIPRIDRAYMEKYVTIEGKEHIAQAFAKGKGVVFAGMHEGSWELSNILCANLGFPLHLFVQSQRFPRLNELLNSYRSQKGCRVVQRKNQTRQLLEILRANESFAITLDQGGKAGVGVDFFGKDASMSSGAVRLALKYGAVIVPAFFARIDGPHIKVILGSPVEPRQMGSTFEEDVRGNLQTLVKVFEQQIRQYPWEYLWTYKIWKYSRQRDILILSDGKTGHLRQSQGMACRVKEGLERKGIEARIETMSVELKNPFARAVLLSAALFPGARRWQGRLGFLRPFVKRSYDPLVAKRYDIIISCGSSVAALNRLLSIENQARSISLMRPSLLPWRDFDLVAVPEHDRPPKRRNVVALETALNLIDQQYLQEQSGLLAERLGVRRPDSRDLSIGVLLGGDTKEFSLSAPLVAEVLRQAYEAAEALNTGLLVTTSRRTSPAVEQEAERTLTGKARCRLLVIANKENIPEAVGGITGLSRVVICSPESISMISEAIASGRYVVVFDVPGLRRKHRAFIENACRKGYIYLSGPGGVAAQILRLWKELPSIKQPEDNERIQEALKRVI